jgi:hypothetical protein
MVVRLPLRCVALRCVALRCGRLVQYWYSILETKRGCCVAGFAFSSSGFQVFVRKDQKPLFDIYPRLKTFVTHSQDSTASVLFPFESIMRLFDQASSTSVDRDETDRKQEVDGHEQQASKPPVAVVERSPRKTTTTSSIN